MEISSVPADEVSAGPAVDDSLRNRLASKRAELLQQRPIELDVPGYKGILRARYHALDYKEIRSIGERHKNLRDRAEAELNVAVDTLCQACDCLLEVKPDGTKVETPFRWNWQTARELFGIVAGEVPDGSLPRVALRRIVPNSTALMLHYADYDQQARGADEEVTEELEGEYEAA